MDIHVVQYQKNTLFFGKGLIYSAFQYNAMKYILSMTNSTNSKLNNKR